MINNPNSGHYMPGNEDIFFYSMEIHEKETPAIAIEYLKVSTFFWTLLTGSLL